VASPAAAKPGITVAVTRVASGDWTIDYVFPTPARIWFFPRSNGDLEGKPWRPQSWTVETPGVRLERIGRYDALTSATPLRRVRLRMRPFAHPLMADYTPALAFSDGGLAFYSDHFLIVPMASLDAVRALPPDLERAQIVQPPVTLMLNDRGRRLLLRGRALRGKARFALGDTDTYLYSGDARVIETATFAGVIDAGLPGWVRTELDQFTPQIMALYNQRLGTPTGGRPMALIAWQGADKPGWSLGGSVLDRMVVMQISGQRVLARTPDVLAQMRWFIGHESAHFWLGQTVRYARAGARFRRSRISPARDGRMPQARRAGQAARRRGRARREPGLLCLRRGADAGGGRRDAEGRSGGGCLHLRARADRCQSRRRQGLRGGLASAVRKGGWRPGDCG